MRSLTLHLSAHGLDLRRRFAIPSRLVHRPHRLQRGSRNGSRARKWQRPLRLVGLDSDPTVAEDANGHTKQRVVGLECQLFNH